MKDECSLTGHSGKEENKDFDSRKAYSDAGEYGAGNGGKNSHLSRQSKHFGERRLQREESASGGGPKISNELKITLIKNPGGEGRKKPCRDGFGAFQSFL